jgi:excisionase family DNA binding protein
MEKAMNPKEQEFFVDAGVVAEFLGVARETVLALARRGELPAHALPSSNKGLRRTWRFKLSEISAFMEKRK